MKWTSVVVWLCLLAVASGTDYGSQKEKEDSSGEWGFLDYQNGDEHYPLRPCAGGKDYTEDGEWPCIQPMKLCLDGLPFSPDGTPCIGTRHAFSKKPTQRTRKPSQKPTQRTRKPSQKPTQRTRKPSQKPTQRTRKPSQKPTPRTRKPSRKPSQKPTPRTRKPSQKPTPRTHKPSQKPTPRTRKPTAISRPPTPMDTVYVKGRTEVIAKQTYKEKEYCTYRLVLDMDPTYARNVYAMYGDQEAPAFFPAAWQLPHSLLGQNVASAEWFSEMEDLLPEDVASPPDSWLSLSGQKPQVSHIGIPFAKWTSSAPLKIDNGAVFWMDPRTGPGAEHSVVCAQITVPRGDKWKARANFQGKITGSGTKDWTQRRVEWSMEDCSTDLEPTMQPTTVPPSTLPPSTTQPTTKQPTTLQPTTLQPTTMQPTTKQPTTKQPTASPVTTNPTVDGSTASPTRQPSASPTFQPSTSPTLQPSASPARQPTTKQPTTLQPTIKQLTASPVTTNPTADSSTASPTLQPSTSPTLQPSTSPTLQPSTSPTRQPSTSPTRQPTTSPTTQPTQQPTVAATSSPTGCASAPASFTQVSTGTCASQGLVAVVDPAECSSAVSVVFGVSSPFMTLYGEPGCEIGSDGIDYGFCSGGSNSKPTGCSYRSSAYYSHTGSSDEDCSGRYACICKNGCGGSATDSPTTAFTAQPTATTSAPTKQPTSETSNPTAQPTSETSNPTAQPTSETSNPTKQPTSETSNPTKQPTSETSNPTAQPTAATIAPTSQSTAQPTAQPTSETSNPTKQPTSETSNPTAQPTPETSNPTAQATTLSPTSFGGDLGGGIGGDTGVGGGGLGSGLGGLKVGALVEISGDVPTTETVPLLQGSSSTGDEGEWESELIGSKRYTCGYYAANSQYCNDQSDDGVSACTACAECSSSTKCVVSPSFTEPSSTDAVEAAVEWISEAYNGKRYTCAFYSNQPKYCSDTSDQGETACDACGECAGSKKCESSSSSSAPDEWQSELIGKVRYTCPDYSKFPAYCDDVSDEGITACEGCPSQCSDSSKCASSSLGDTWVSKPIGASGKTYTCDFYATFPQYCQDESLAGIEACSACEQCASSVKCS